MQPAASVEDFRERNLHILQSLKGWEMQTKSFGAAAHSSELVLAREIAVVEVAEFLAAKGWGATRDAIVLEMVAERNGHKAS